MAGDNISWQCKNYEAYSTRNRSKAPFPIELRELLLYIKYRGRSSIFCKHLMNLEIHPDHGQEWFNRMTKEPEIQEEMRHFIKKWNPDLSSHKTPVVGIDYNADPSYYDATESDKEEFERTKNSLPKGPTKQQKKKVKVVDETPIVKPPPQYTNVFAVPGRNKVGFMAVSKPSAEAIARQTAIQASITSHPNYNKRPSLHISAPSSFSIMLPPVTTRVSESSAAQVVPNRPSPKLPTKRANDVHYIRSTSPETTLHRPNVSKQMSITNYIRSASPDDIIHPIVLIEKYLVEVEDDEEPIQPKKRKREEIKATSVDEDIALLLNRKNAKSTLKDNSSAPVSKQKTKNTKLTSFNSTSKVKGKAAESTPTKKRPKSVEPAANGKKKLKSVEPTSRKRKISKSVEPAIKTKQSSKSVEPTVKGRRGSKSVEPATKGKKGFKCVHTATKEEKTVGPAARKKATRNNPVGIISTGLPLKRAKSPATKKETIKGKSPVASRAKKTTSLKNKTAESTPAVNNKGSTPFTSVNMTDFSGPSSSTAMKEKSLEVAPISNNSSTSASTTQLSPLVSIGSYDFDDDYGYDFDKDLFMTLESTTLSTQEAAKENANVTIYTNQPRYNVPDYDFDEDTNYSTRQNNASYFLNTSTNISTTHDSTTKPATVLFDIDAPTTITPTQPKTAKLKEPKEEKKRERPKSKKPDFDTSKTVKKPDSNTSKTIKRPRLAAPIPTTTSDEDLLDSIDPPSTESLPPSLDTGTAEAEYDLVDEFINNPDSEFTEEVYDAYIAGLERIEQEERRTGIIIQEPELMVLSHVAIERYDK